MKKILLILTILAILPGITKAQIRQEIIPIASGNSVALILTVPPASTESFHVYRQGPLHGSKDYVWLTPDEPIKPVIDANQVKATLGDQWQTLTVAFGTEQPFDIMRKLRGDDFIGMVHSLISPKVAELTGRWFLDTGLEKGATYKYRIIIVTSSGKEKAVLETEIKVTDILPSPPTGLKAETSDGKVMLTWSYPKWSGKYDDLAIQYYVHRKKGDGDYSKLDHMPIVRDDLSDPSYTDRWLENGVTYTYFITAVDPLGRQSKPSVETTVTPKDNIAPSMPSGLVADGGDGVVTLYWDMALELDVAGYNVYRSTGLKEEFVKINEKAIGPNMPVYFDSTITNGVQYFYSITAVDLSGNESNRSNAITTLGEDKTPPEPPSNLRHDIKNRILTLTWSPSKARDLAGYYVYRGQTEDIQPKIIHEPYVDTFFVDKGYQAEGMTAGKPFWVSVTAVDKSRNESEKLSLLIEIPDDVPPSPPQGFVAENVNGRYVNISCGRSPSLDVATYQLFRDGNAIANFDTAPFSYKDTAITKGNDFTYYCVALDSAGNKSESGRIDTVKVKDNSPPPSPRNCLAKLIESGVQLKWERVIDFDLVGYNIYRSTMPSGVYQKLNTSPLENLEYIDPQGNGTFYYKVKAVDTSGNESTRSEAVNAS